MWDFESNTEVAADAVGTIPAQFRPFYSPTPNADGKLTLRLDDVVVKGAVEAVSGLGKALGSERKLTAELKKGKVDLSALADFGATPEEIKAAVDAQLAAAKKGSGINPEKIREEVAKGFAEKLTGAEQRALALQTQLHTMLVDRDAVSALTGKAVDPDLALPFVKQQIKVVEEDGKVGVLVVDAAGDRRYSTVTGQPMTVAELVGEMQGNPKYAPLFASTKPSGIPGPGNTQRPVKHGAQSGSDLSPTDKIRQGLDSGALAR